jgi:hypothetical protein
MRIVASHFSHNPGIQVTHGWHRTISGNQRLLKITFRFEEIG